MFDQSPPNLFELGRPTRQSQTLEHVFEQFPSLSGGSSGVEHMICRDVFGRLVRTIVGSLFGVYVCVC